MIKLKFCTKIMKSKRLSYFYFDMSYVIPDYYYESLLCYLYFFPSFCSFFIIISDLVLLFIVYLVHFSDANSDSYPRTSSFQTDQLIELVQKANSSVPVVIKQ